MTAVVKATVLLEKFEGYFRYAHANIRSSAESLAFCGKKAAIFEKKQQYKKLKGKDNAMFLTFSYYKSK